ncbi:hypothetical protein BJ165DRAFT_1403555 [Panaeolus papilionaceus]|nr:hypothetical protein BJ165DRAFT_1403555 [Panaeolus papilionaceus]
MSTALSGPAPSYDTPAVDQNILNLSKTALDIQNGFTNARHAVEKLSRSLDVHDASDKLRDIDEMYNDLFHESKDAANALLNNIHQFMDRVAPHVAKEDTPIEGRKLIAKMAADKISQAVKQNKNLFDKNLPSILNDLKSVFDVIKAEERKYTAQSAAVLEHADHNIAILAAYIEANDTLYKRVVGSTKNLWSSFRGNKPKPSPTLPIKKVQVPGGGAGRNKSLQVIVDGIQRISDFITGGPALKASDEQLEENIQELIVLKGQIDKQASDLKVAVKEMEEISKDFADLGKLAVSFKSAWEKIDEHAAVLSMTIDSGKTDEQVVMREIGVYKSIQLALDEYVLRV